jgi:pimeloyl-ACP methyl ester carboxylesterase
MRKPKLRYLAVGAALVVAISAIGVLPANASAVVAGLHNSNPPTTVPDDQPLPGFTIVNPPLAPAMVNGVASTVRQGVTGHAGYIIETPPNWNGDLVVWDHGFRGQGMTLTVDAPGFGLRQKFLNQGYAWAASSYSKNGFNIQVGVLASKGIADFFRKNVARPHRTFLAGVSMGGYIIGRALEQYPGFFEGALPMCGVMGDQTLIDFYTDYNLVAQDLAGVRSYPIPLDYLTNQVPQIQAALGLTTLTPTGPDTTNDLGKQLRAVTLNETGGPRPGDKASFAFWKNFLFQIATPTVPPSPDDTPGQRPGKITTNLFTRYDPNSPVDLNRTIQRVAPEDVRQRLSPFLTEVPKIEGRPFAKVVTLHGLGDMFVPFSMEQRYAEDVARHLQSFNVVQRAIRSTNHCEFSPTEAGTAWDDLVTWVRTGKRPAGDKVLDEAAVADPNFGCQFSDKAAFTAGTGTRRLYAACP